MINKVTKLWRDKKILYIAQVEEASWFWTMYVYACPLYNLYVLPNT